MLRNRAYLGEIYFRGQHHRAPHPPLIDIALFERVANLLDERGEDYAKRQQTVNEEYLLTGLVVCTRCQKRFLGTAATGRSCRYQYYTCYSRNRYGTKTCAADRLPANQLDEAVLKSIMHTFDRNHLFEQAVKTATQQTARLRTEREAELANVRDSIKKTDEGIERYLLAFENGSLPEALFADRIKELSAKSSELKVRRDDLRELLAAGAIRTPSKEQLRTFREEISDRYQPRGRECQEAANSKDRPRRSGGEPTKITPIFQIPSGTTLNENEAVRAMNTLVGVTGLEPVTSAV